MSILATDNFNRANANPIGGNWTTVTALTAFQIVSNVATPSALASDAGSFYNAVTWPNDQYSQAQITVTDTLTDGSGPGVMVRASSVALTAYRVVLTHASPGTNVSLQRFLAGAFTRLWDRGAAFTDGDTVRLEAQGTTLRVFINGVQVGADFTDANIASGSAGISYSSVSTAASVDNWEGGDFATGGSAPAALFVAPRFTRTPVRPIAATPTMGPPQVIALPPITVVRHVKQPPEPPPVVLTPPLLPAQAQPVAPIWVTPQSRNPAPEPVVVTSAQIPPAAGILPLTTTLVVEQFRPGVVRPIVLTPPPLPQAPAPISVTPAQAQPTLHAVIALAPPSLPQYPAPIVVVQTWRPTPAQPIVSQPTFPAAVQFNPAPIVVVTSARQPQQPQIWLSQPTLPAVAMAAAATLVVPTFTRPAPAPVLTGQASFLPTPAMPAAVMMVNVGPWRPGSTVIVLTPPRLDPATCQLPRPSSGLIARPTGTTTRPLASTARTTGVTLRPNSGDTDNPC